MQVMGSNIASCVRGGMHLWHAAARARETASDDVQHLLVVVEKQIDTYDLLAEETGRALGEVLEEKHLWHANNATR